MAVGLSKNVFLVLLLAFFTAVHAAPTVKKGGCTNPRVRREWRALSESERKDWVDAVKVGYKPQIFALRLLTLLYSALTRCLTSQP